jgi:ubiquinone/menaquinone biosynthesis C-methylase UbiE
MISKIEAGTKEDIQKFWKSLYHSLYDNVETALSSEMLFKALDDLEDMFRYRDHLAVIEMPLKELAGKRVLEIGTGAGGHSALFAKHGAVVTGVDLTPDRVQATSRKFSLMGDRASGCIALQADAENLPFADGSFDIVYSNGVLHHTVDTNKALDEAYRVLKPGGRLVMMLYCKDSWHYWVNMWLCVGLLQGKALRDANWLGRATEWGGKDRQSVGNPYTRCYSRQEMQGLMGR